MLTVSRSEDSVELNETLLRFCVIECCVREKAKNREKYRERKRKVEKRERDRESEEKKDGFFRLPLLVTRVDEDE